MKTCRFGWLAFSPVSVTRLIPYPRRGWLDARMDKHVDPLACRMAGSAVGEQGDRALKRLTGSRNDTVILFPYLDLG
jgi:hypothetical protein